MKLSWILFVAVGAMASLCFAGEVDTTKDKKVKVAYAAIVNDTIPNAVCPSGVVRISDRELVAIFHDRGDLLPGTKVYLSRSTNLGRTWGKPYLVLSSDEPNVGRGATLASLPNGEILLVETNQVHHSSDRTAEAAFKARSSIFQLKISSDGAKTFRSAGKLDTPTGATGYVMGTVVKLSNGDLILPAYIYPGHFPRQEGYRYGSGFFRSKDEGQSWGGFEVAFEDPVPGRTAPLFFNEAAYVVRPNGSIVAYARIDSEIAKAQSRFQFEGNHLWFTESRDLGKTWSTPQASNIGGVFPAIVRMESGRYLLVCGDRHAKRIVTFYTSDDALDFKPAGFAPYLRTNGEVGHATGGANCLLPLSDNEVYVTYYASDNTLKTPTNTYVEGCAIEVP